MRAIRHGWWAVCLWIALMAARPAEAEELRQGVLRGQVRAMGGRTPVIGASVVWKGAGETGRGITDAEGRFELQLSAGAGQLVVDADGFAARSIDASVVHGETRELDVALEPVAVNPYETTVVGGRGRDAPARVSLARQELHEVPGTMGDPFRVVMTMPGVASVMSGVSYPVVRGASPASTGYFLDGVRLPALYHLFLGPAVIHPDFIDKIDFFPGAAPARYGRLLGGVIEGKVRAPREDRVRGSVSLDLINAGAFAEVPISQTHTNVTAAARYSYTPWIISLASQATDGFQIGSSRSDFTVDFWDYQGRIEQRVGKGSLRALAFGSGDRAGLTTTSFDGFGAMNEAQFHRVDLRFRWPLLEGQGEVGFTLGLDRLGFASHATQTGDSALDSQETTFAGRARLTTEVGSAVSLEIGGDVEARMSRVALSALLPQYFTEPLTLEDPTADAVISGLYSQLDWKPFGESLVVMPGLRFDAYHLSPGVLHSALEPRLGARWKVTEGLALKSGVGLYHQAPTTVMQLPFVDAASLKYGLQEAVQTDLGFEIGPVERFALSVDGYFNWLTRTLELNPFSTESFDRSSRFQEAIKAGRRPTFEDLVDGEAQAASGVAYGVEVMVRRELGGQWFGWLSYAWQQSARRETITDYDVRGVVVGRTTALVPYTFEQAHILNAVLSRRLGRWTLGLAGHFNTGRPESGVMTSVTLRTTDAFGRTDWRMIDASQVDRLPSYWRLDFRIARTFLFEDFTLDAYLDVQNVGFSQETVAFNYRGGSLFPGGPLKKSAEGIPVVLPILGVKASY